MPKRPITSPPAVTDAGPSSLPAQQSVLLQSSGAAQDHASQVDFDRRHVWHPYTSMSTPGTVRLVDHATGVRLTMADGTELIDAMASWWCMLHGYRHPALDAAVRRQLDSMAHVMFGGLTHAPAIELGGALVAMTPAALQHVFLADSGSVSVEVALKMAIQFQQAKGRPHRSRFLALVGGYHGDTSGAMSVCDPTGGMHSLFSGLLRQQVFAPRPPPGIGADIDAWEVTTRMMADRYSQELAGIICEPVLQGAGGMHIYNPRCLHVLREIADEHGLVLILDEIATGFGRTGELFAVDHSDVEPDIMCVGKALTGGYLSLAATLCSGEVARGVSASAAGVLMHGPTFMANPLACAVANANLALLESGGWRDDVHRIESGLRADLEPAMALPDVVDVRVIGAVGVIQLARPVDVDAATAAAAAKGVWIRPFRDLIYTMPPYVTDTDDLATICSGMIAAAAL
ncbi:MAG: adenosylmethionine--8-amino-7-oxononanoate transaminase [Nocardioidaceae bacterium]